MVHYNTKIIDWLSSAIKVRSYKDTEWLQSAGLFMTLNVFLSSFMMLPHKNPDL